VHALPVLGLLGLILGGVPGLLIGMAASAGVAFTSDIFCGAIGSGSVNLLYGTGRRTSSLQEQIAGDLNIVRFHKMNQRFDRALETVEEVLERDPDFPEALFLKAQVLWDGFEDYAGTSQCLQRVMEVSPDESAAFHRWAVRMYEEMHKKNELTADKRRFTQTDTSFFECGSGNQPSLKLWLTSAECGNKNRSKRKEF
jgi:tetratricopeptide (TPR) repeat protein